MSAYSPATQSSRRYVLLLLLVYPFLAIAGVITHRQIFPLLASALLWTALWLPQLLARRWRPWLAWLLGLGGLLWLSWHGWSDILLELLPVLISALLAYGFGRTLHTRKPLVARFIVTLEGPERLAAPGVARYARQVTWFWTLLLTAQALLLLVLLCVGPGGVLARAGVAPLASLQGPWVAAWLHVGGYLWIGVAFLLEYGYRRWRLRHLDHPTLSHMLAQLALRWPQLVHGEESAP
ncbi:MAG: xanthomonadin biosynthesis protein [Rhodanobacter sp.]